MYGETNIHVTLILHRTFKYIDEKSGTSVTTKIIHLINAKLYINIIVIYNIQFLLAKTKIQTWYF